MSDVRDLVTVRQLGWTWKDQYDWYESWGGMPYKYWVRQDDGRWWWRTKTQNWISADTKAAAKARAQADFEARIKGHLMPRDAPPVAASLETEWRAFLANDGGGEWYSEIAFVIDWAERAIAAMRDTGAVK